MSWGNYAKFGKILKSIRPVPDEPPLPTVKMVAPDLEGIPSPPANTQIRNMVRRDNAINNMVGRNGHGIRRIY